MDQRQSEVSFKDGPRRNSFLRTAALCLVALLCAATVHAAKFTASLDRESIVLGESVTLKLEFNGVNPGGMPPLPAIPGLQVAGGLGSGSSSSIGPEGQSTVSWYTIPLTANQPGEFTIPAFHIDVGGQKLSSPPLKLKVLREDPNTPPAELGEKSAFLWLTLPKSECYVGETIVAELRLYIRQGVRNIGGFNTPPLQGDGFTSGKQWNQAAQMQRRVGRRIFTAIPFSTSLTVVKSGPVKISSLNATIVLNPPDAFDGFFGRRNDSEQVALATGEKEIRALLLPTENVPLDFNGAIGNFTMNFTAGPTNVATGDPITIRVQISGRGALDGVSLPAQTAWQGFRTYPPTANVETDPLGIQGTKTFEQIVSPENTDLRELPPFSFSFFDPDAKQYRTLTQPAVKLTVRPGGSAPMPVIAANKNQSTEPPPPARDIVHIKPRLGSLKKIGPPLIQQPWFLAVNCAPVMAWLAAIGWRRRAEALANNPRLRRQRQVAQIVRDGLMELRRLAAANQSDEFFATLFRLLQEQLGERLDCPASAITEAVIEEKLRPRGVANETLAELHELFQAHNLARYAPAQSGRELAALIPRLENSLTKLREVKS
ncbi:MAG: protein BatD [Pedosphaera sp.]|nr:protein BatD [Pedosphaera sp.]